MDAPLAKVALADPLSEIHPVALPLPGRAGLLDGPEAVRTPCQDIRVVIPAGSTRTLRQCVEAVRTALKSRGAQSEIVIVYDRSEPLGLADETARPPLRELHVEAGKAASARNQGSRSFAEGILVFVDADVIAEPEAIEALVVPILEGRAEATVGSYSPRVDGMTFFQKYKQLYLSTVYGQSGYLKNEFWSALSAVRAEAFHALGGFCTSFEGACGEDTDLGQKMTAAGQRILAVPEAAGRHLHEFTFLRLVKNDWKKGVQMVLGALRNRNSVGDLRHSKRSDMLAVAAVYTLLLLPVAALFLPLLLIGPAALGVLAVWIACRRRILRPFFRYRWGFGLRTIPVAMALDFVRGACVIYGGTCYALERRRR